LQKLAQYSLSETVAESTVSVVAERTGWIARKLGGGWVQNQERANRGMRAHTVPSGRALACAKVERRTANLPGQSGSVATLGEARDWLAKIIDGKGTRNRYSRSAGKVLLTDLGISKKQSSSRSGSNARRASG